MNWIKVDDALPRKKTWVWVWTKTPNDFQEFENINICYGLQVNDGEWFTLDGQKINEEVTHWMFIPRVPQN